MRPNGVKTQKKKARTDGDLPLGDDTEVPESVVPCGSGGEVGIAIVAPPPSPAHDAWPHGHGVSIEHQRRILAIRRGGQHRTEYCGGHVTYYPKKDGKPGGRFEATCGRIWKHGIRYRLTRTWVGIRSQNEERGRPSLVLYFPKMQTKMPPPFLCFGERAERRNALVAQPNGADLAMLERPLREGESLEPQTSA